jgi:hypothetical protein
VGRELEFTSNIAIASFGIWVGLAAFIMMRFTKGGRMLSALKVGLPQLWVWVLISNAVPAVALLWPTAAPLVDAEKVAVWVTVSVPLVAFAKEELARGKAFKKVVVAPA